MGPAKPQRSVNNNNNSSGPAEVEHCHLLAGSSATTTPPPPPHRLCLETSFTSQQLHTVIDDNESNHLPWEFVSLVSPISEKRSEFLHDEWFGLAPLARPESFSEVSSISSRTSSMIGCKKKKHRAKESFSVRFDETVKDTISDEGTDISDTAGCNPDPRKNILTRLFRKKKKETERTRQKSRSPPPKPPETTTKFDESTTSNESSPLLSSLHLLTDQRFAEILGRPLTNDNTSGSSSFHSGHSLQDIPATVSSDSVTVNVEVHQSPEMMYALRSESSLGGDSLLEDIERSLNMSLSRTGSSARLSLSRTGSTAKLTEVEIDIGEPRCETEAHPGGSGTKYMYPILLVGHGESSV